MKCVCAIISFCKIIQLSGIEFQCSSTWKWNAKQSYRNGLSNLISFPPNIENIDIYSVYIFTAIDSGSGFLSTLTPYMVSTM